MPPERLQSAISLNQLVFNAGAVVGPAIGGVIVAAVGVSAAYLVDTLTYGAAILALLLMRPIPPAPGAVRPSVAAVVEGLRFARRRRPVLGTFVVDLVAMVFGSPRSLFPAMALDVFMVGPVGLGLFSSAIALGAMLGALFTGWTTRVRRPGRAVLIAVTIWGLGIAGFGLCTFSFPLALLCLAIAAARRRRQRGAALVHRPGAHPGRAAGPRELDPHPGRDRRAADRGRGGCGRWPRSRARWCPSCPAGC